MNTHWKKNTQHFYTSLYYSGFFKFKVSALIVMYQRTIIGLYLVLYSACFSFTVISEKELVIEHQQPSSDACGSLVFKKKNSIHNLFNLIRLQTHFVDVLYTDMPVQHGYDRSTRQMTLSNPTWRTRRRKIWQLSPDSTTRVMLCLDRISHRCTHRSCVKKAPSVF